MVSEMQWPHAHLMDFGVYHNLWSWGRFEYRETQARKLGDFLFHGLFRIRCLPRRVLLSPEGLPMETISAVGEATGHACSLQISSEGFLAMVALQRDGETCWNWCHKLRIETERWYQVAFYFDCDDVVWDVVGVDDVFFDDKLRRWNRRAA
jgi:hypothetical protein